MRARFLGAGAVGVLLLAAGCTGDDSPTPAAGGTPSTVATSAAPTSPTPAPTSPGGATGTGGGTGTGGATADATAAVRLSNLSGESTRLRIDESFTTALRALRVELQPTGRAQVENTGGATTFVFPVTGGQVSLDPDGRERLSGTVEHRGGLRLSALGRTATVENLVLDAGQDQLTAEVAGRRVPLLPIDASDARIIVQGNTVTVTDDGISLEGEAAQRLADQLGLPALPNVQLGQLESTLTGSG